MHQNGLLTLFVVIYKRFLQQLSQQHSHGGFLFRLNSFVELIDVIYTLCLNAPTLCVK